MNQDKEYYSASVFKLIQTNSPEILSFNKGFNGELNVGLFHFIGANLNDPNNHKYSVCKPIEDYEENKTQAFFIDDIYLKNKCKILLSLTLNNN